MARTDRLMRLMTALRGGPQPATAARLAAETGVSARQLYRDIATLRAGGALIDGAAGVGYRLTEDPALPPQSFSRLEIEALSLAVGELRGLGTPGLEAAGRAALARIVATLPERQAREAAHTVLMSFRTLPVTPPVEADLTALLDACWHEQVLALRYRDLADHVTEREVWPLAVSIHDRTLMLLGWCCLRGDFRMFHVARIEAARATGASFRPRRVGLLRDYAAAREAEAGHWPPPARAMPCHPEEPAMTRPVTRFNAAIVRRPGASVVSGLRAEDRGDPSLAGVRAEHDAYVAALRDAGLAVTVLDPLEEFPDSIFVEDPALVFSEGAILLAPGAATRAGEVATLAPVLRDRFAQVLDLAEGHADGGDVLVLADRVMIGLSARTDRRGAEALVAALATLGRRGEIVETPAGVLHFKTDCAALDDSTVLATARLAASGVFDGLRVLTVPEGEEAAANALALNDVVLAGADFPRTIARLEAEGYRVVPMGTREVGKIDAGLSCMSLRWFDPQAATGA